MNMLSLILDISTLLFIVLITATSVKRGLIVSIIEFVGGIIAAIAASFLGWLAAVWVYNLSIKGTIINTVESAIFGVGGLTSENIFSVLPKSVQNSLGFDGINSSNFLSSGLKDNSKTIAESVEQLVSPYMISYIAKICMVVIFTVLMIVIITLSSKLSRHFDSSGLKLAENLLSLIFGLVKSVFIIMALIVLINAIVLTLDSGANTAFYEAVNSSLLFKPLYSINILSFIITLVAGV